MRNTLAFLLIFSVTCLQVSAGAGTNFINPPVAPAQDDPWQISFTPDQLENLLAPIALYPDPLLAQVLLAATFPDQIDEAARTLRAYNNRYDVEATNWDVSVKAVAHYPTVLSMMADKIDWTTSIGQAYVNQSTDVMDAIQRLRRQARSMGNLATTAQQEIVETDGDIYIYPAQPQYIYVPTYDPAIVYFRRAGFFLGPVIVFSIGFGIGAWLNHDCDWHQHRVFYHGWEHGPVWVVRSRPYIHVNNVYVNRRYENVIINRTVIDHHVNYGALDRYRAIHRDTDYSNVRRDRGTVGARHVPPGPEQARPDNKIIRRNIDPYDPRIDANRGRGGLPQTQPQVRRDARPEIHTPQAPTPPVTGRGHQGDERARRDMDRMRPMPPTQPGGTVQSPRQPDSVFRGNAGGIDSREASRRGQVSRQHEYRPAPSAPPGAQTRQQGPLPSKQGGQSGKPHGRTR